MLCRGSAAAGLGHVMRSRAVAQQLQRHGPTRLVVVGDRFVEGLLEGRALDYRIVADEEPILSELEAFRPAVVVFDLNRLAVLEPKVLRGRCRTVGLSPLFDRLEQVDLVFTRAPVPDLADAAHQRRFCGLQYAVVGEHCARIPERIYRATLRHDPLAVAVSMGGTDAPNKTLDVLRAVRTVPPGILFWVLLGEGYAHSYQELIDCVKRDRRHEIILAKTSRSLWRILSACALAILAGGITAYEAAFAGLPSLNVLERETHRFLLQELEDRGACRYLGAPLQTALPALTGALAHLNSHREELLAMHRSSRDLLDGLGARRIADQIAGSVRER